jgi:beta-lactam-binding protein with PASTA domain
VIASDILRELDLGVNVQERKVPVGSGENALVIDQDPDPGTMVEPGTVVTIYVAQESSNQ